MLCDNGHTENITFDLISTRQFVAILRVPWLQLHNPQIDWQKRNVTLGSNFCVHSCYPEPVDYISPLICGVVDQVSEFRLPEEYLEYSDIFNQVKLPSCRHTEVFTAGSIWFQGPTFLAVESTH